MLGSNKQFTPTLLVGPAQSHSDRTLSDRDLVLVAGWADASVAPTGFLVSRPPRWPTPSLARCGSTRDDEVYIVLDEDVHGPAQVLLHLLLALQRASYPSG